MRVPHGPPPLGAGACRRIPHARDAGDVGARDDVAPGACAAESTKSERSIFVASEPAYGGRSGEGWLTFPRIMIIVPGR